MSLAVRFFEPSDAPAWDAFVLNHPLGSPFHLTAWKASIEETFGFRGLSLLALRDNQIAGVLPLFEVKNPFAGRLLLSSPFAVYGGALFDSQEAAAALTQELNRVARQMAVEYVELRNAFPEQCLGFHRLSRYVTFTHPIAASGEAILSSLSRNARNMVRKALRHPFTLEPASTLDAFFDLYTANLRRLGTPAFPRSHFVNLLKHYGKSADVREVKLNGQTAAAVFTFYFRGQILPYYGASDPAFHSYAPNNFMYFDLMRWGAAHGYAWFDFGRSKKEGSGSYAFKTHWGMTERDLPYEVLLVRRKSLPDLSPNNPRFELAIRFWRTLPLPLTRALGPWLIRWFP
jgi:FemAB-related protein (PEP-CTERM system-associated)